MLTGSELTDIHITLKNGRAHIQYTDGGDFRESTYRAIRHGLITGESQLLEPFYNVTITVEAFYVGRILSDVERMSGTFEPPTSQGAEMLITAVVPAVNMQWYISEFTSFTHGEGRIFLSFGGYKNCHNSKEVIEKLAYNAEADTDNTPDSVFCAKGAGYNVHWTKARDTMQLEIIK